MEVEQYLLCNENFILLSITVQIFHCEKTKIHDTLSQSPQKTYGGSLATVWWCVAS